MRERADGLARRMADRELEIVEARGRFQPDPAGTAAAASERLAELTPEHQRLEKLQADVTRLADACRGHLERASTSDQEADRLAARRGTRSVQLRALAERAGELRAALAEALRSRASAELEREEADSAQREATEAGLDAASLIAARESLNAVSRLLEDRSELATRIAGDETQLVANERQLEPARARVAAAEQALTTHELERTGADSAARIARERAGRLATAATQVVNAAEHHAAAQATAATARSAAEEAAVAYAAAHAALATAREQREHARTAREAAQRENAVAHVAAGCAPGDPCPVCERDLPGDFAVATAPDLDAADADAAATQLNLDRAAAVERDAASACTRDAERRAAAEQALEAAATALAGARTTAQAQADTTVDSPAAATAAAHAAEDVAAQAEAALAVIDARRPALVEEHRAAAQLLTRLMADDQALERSLAERRADHVRMSEELATAVAALPALAEATEAGVAAAHEIVATQLADAEAVTKRVTTAQRVYEDAVRAVHVRELRLRDEVTTPAAAVRAELEGLAVELNEDQLTFGPEPEALVPAAEALEAQIDERVKQLRAEAVEARSAEQADRTASEQALNAVGLTAPALAERLNQLAGELFAADREHATASAQIEPVARLDALRCSASTLRAGFEDLKDALADSRFVGYVVRRRQLALLQHASRVLQDITGRYAFTEDFQILDSESGFPRSPDTLSGGETFIASLALALGLVEVADRSGGDLRALFLDEGFGTLDATILDTALTALEERAKAGRLIGLISHVPTVAERIDTVLEVRSNLEGSSIHILDREQREERVLDALAAELP
ncbi:SbcC/MukB-like Walker B domain-containing protein [Solirubrobacter pauli]|nr:SbcC/MukB-like Walker B domain-containing protein [Solirubrobacter pauli]